MTSSFLRDQRGTSVVEFALTAPLFGAMLMAVCGAGLLAWTQTGLQHAVEMAARCASVNRTVCGSTSDVQQYASSQSAGLNLPPSTFEVSQAGCGTRVTASYVIASVATMWGVPAMTLRAEYCHPRASSG